MNDLAWGSGFTDWALVAAANAFQWWKKRAPSAGFYDLSRDKDISEQFRVAAKAGLNGFGIYHYWFEEGPELNSVERWLLKGALPEGFSFFLIWATESWSKRWAGKEHETIRRIDVRPDGKSVGRHVAYLTPLLAHGSCHKLQGRPMFAFYRPEFFSDPEETVLLYRQAFANAGLDVAIGFFAKNRNDASFGRLFDFSYLFEPRLFFNTRSIGRYPGANLAYRRLLRLLPYEKVEALSSTLSAGSSRKSRSYSFEEFVHYFSSKERLRLAEQMACPVQNVFSCGWNNAPRYRSNFTELVTPTPQQFDQVLAVALEEKIFCSELPLLCNAWNEWSEGAALEPCDYLGSELVECYAKGSALGGRLVRH